jgi:hypothetical protein
MHDLDFLDNIADPRDILVVRGVQLHESIRDEAWIDLPCAGEEQLMSARSAEEVSKTANYDSFSARRPWFLSLV